MKLSYYDDIFRLSHCYAHNEFAQLRQEILDMKDSLTYYIEDDGEIWGYNIKKNEPVSQVYGFDVFVVRFAFSSVETLHDAKQVQNAKKLMAHLRTEMEEGHAYYNVRIPANIMDVYKCMNDELKRGFFCGGTVEYYIDGHPYEIPYHEGLRIFYPDNAYLQANRDILLDITYQSFKTYQGQYHISPVLCKQASVIYNNWIEWHFDHFEEGRVLVTEYHGEPVGIMTTTETEYAVEATLSGISTKYRKLGAYSSMIGTLVNRAYEHGKTFTTSTQLDNYVVQKTWIGMGARPYFTYYNVHYDFR